jgi:predicted Zn-dependent protease
MDNGANAFLRTHPLTTDRIAFLQQQVATSPYRGKPVDPGLIDEHARMVAKLQGFLATDPRQVLRLRKGDSLYDRYARAIAWYRIPDLDKAVPAIDQLIKEEPANPWFHELKGQMLFENGRTKEAVGPYRLAVQNRPASSLLRLGLGRALLEQDDQASWEEARATLKEAVRIEPGNAGAWRFLGIAEGKLGNDAQASLALAEMAVLVGKREDALLYINRAQQGIQPDSPDWYRLQDLMREAEELPAPRRQGR